MAKAKVVKSKRGNDLIVVTMGPKEAASVSAVLELADDAKYIGDVKQAIDGARFTTSNEKFADAYVKNEVTVTLSE